MTKWISVKERLPEIGQHVLGFTTKGFDYVDRHLEGERHIDHIICYMINNGENNWFIEVLNKIAFELEDITHWMPLPEPPEQG